MQKSSLIFISFIAIAAIGLFYLPATQKHDSQEQEYFKKQFESFKIKFDRKYQPSIEKYRFQVFVENLLHINKHNMNTEATYKMGVNQFADITHEEFVQKVLNPELHKMLEERNIPSEASELPGAPPASVDWRGKGVITPVRDQGDCGSSWTFSATGTMQSILAIKNKTLVEFSKQQLLDCCNYPKYGCEGCKGAFPDWAMSYVKDAGIVLDSQYPYTIYQDTCKPVPTAKKVLNHTKPFFLYTNTTTTNVKNLVAEGPISLSVDAYKWQFYASGVYTDCHDDHVTLATLLVGYQSDDVWIMRNSWGTTWGQQGYIRVTNKGTACLIRSHVVVPNFGA